MKKVLRKKNLFCLPLILIIFLFQSCATFDKNLINPYELNNTNLSELNGQYEIVPYKFDTIAKKYKKQIWMYNNFLKEIDRNLLKDTLKIDSLKTYKFSLQVLNPSNIKISYLENGEVFRERVLKTKLKKDGYLYLKNKNVGSFLIPYILGTIDIKKTRLTKSKKERLIFDVTNHRSGGFFVFALLGWNTSKYRKEYEKIE